MERGETWSEEKPLNVLVNIQRMVHLFVAVDTVCKSSDALKIELIFVSAYVMAREFKPAEFHETCCGENFFPQQKTGMSQEENYQVQHVHWCVPTLNYTRVLGISSFSEDT